MQGLGTQPNNRLPPIDTTLRNKSLETLKTLQQVEKLRRNAPIRRHYAQSLIRPIRTYTLAHKPTFRTLELACPKWAYFTTCGRSRFRFLPRYTPMPEETTPIDADSIWKMIPTLAQVESPMPEAIFFVGSKATELPKEEPKLIIFPPAPTKPHRPCSERLNVLALPRQNWMKIRKKQIEAIENVYKVSKAALAAVPSDRINQLAKPRLPAIKYEKTTNSRDQKSIQAKIERKEISEEQDGKKVEEKSGKTKKTKTRLKTENTQSEDTNTE